MGVVFNKYTFNDDSISFQFKSNREYEVTKFLMMIKVIIMIYVILIVKTKRLF